MRVVGGKLYPVNVVFNIQVVSGYNAGGGVSIKLPVPDEGVAIGST